MNRPLRVTFLRWCLAVALTLSLAWSAYTARTSTAATPGVLGSTVVTGGAFDTGDSNSLTGIQVVTDATGGTVTTAAAYVGNIDSASLSYGLGLYSDNAGKPGTRLVSAAGTLAVAGWNALPLSVVLAPTTKYWLLYNTKTTHSADNVLYFLTGTPGGWSGPVTCCTFPTTVPGWTGAADQFALTLTLASAPPTNTPVPPTATGTSTATQTPVPTSTATATDTPVPSDTATPVLPCVDTAYGCLVPGDYTFGQYTLTDSGGNVVWTSPPVDPFIVTEDMDTPLPADAPSPVLIETTTVTTDKTTVS